MLQCNKWLREPTHHMSLPSLTQVLLDCRDICNGKDGLSGFAMRLLPANDQFL
jgi:hypothetical protein